MSRAKTPEEDAWALRFGRWLRVWRDRRGLSQEELSARLPGAGQQAVSKYELGESAPTAFHLVAIISELRVDPIELMIDLGPGSLLLDYRQDTSLTAMNTQLDDHASRSLPTPVDEELNALIALLEQPERRRVADFMRQLIKGR